MPSAPPGSVAVESSVLYRLDKEALEALAEAAAASRAVLVESPTIVSVEGPSGPLLASLGPASLVFPDDPGIELPPPGPFRLRSREWIDGCQVSRVADAYTPEGAYVERSGRLVAVDYRDPVALLLNGTWGIFEVYPDPLEGEVPLATLDDPRGPLALGRLPDGRYAVHVRGGGIADLALAIAGLRGGCGG